MATKTMVPLATTTLTATDTSITFSSIDTATYRDLRIVINGEAASPYAVIYFRMNNDTTTFVDTQMFRGTGGSRQAATVINTDTKAIATWSGFEADQFGIIVADFIDAGGTDVNTHILTRSSYYGDAGTVLLPELFVSAYKTIDAVTSIEVTINGGGLKTGSVLSLYGVEGIV